MITRRPTENYRIIQARAKNCKRFTTQDLTYFRFWKKKKRHTVFPLLTLCNNSNVNDGTLWKQLHFRVMNSHSITLRVYVFFWNTSGCRFRLCYKHVKYSALRGNDWNKISLLKLLKTPEFLKTNLSYYHY